MTRPRGASDADSSRVPELIYARVIRQFERGRGDVLVLERFFHLATAPTVGDRFEVAGLPEPLAVVAVTVRPRPTDLGTVPADLDLFLEDEPIALAEAATAGGWQATPPPSQGQDK